MTSRCRIGLRSPPGAKLLPLSQPRSGQVTSPRAWTDPDRASCSNGPLNGAPERAWSGSATGQRACPLGLRMPLTIEQGERQGPWRPLGGVSAGSCRLAGVGPSGPIQMAATHKRTNLPAESGKCEAKARPFTQPPAAHSAHSDADGPSGHGPAHGRPPIGCALGGAGCPHYMGGRVPFG